jgi:tellurite methyltransferase
MVKQFNDKAYWENYYNVILKTKQNTKPSDFAKFIINEKLVGNGDSIIELGCGNGRDSMFFSENNTNVIAVDQCANTTEVLNNIDGIKSYASDFTNLESLSEKIDVVYSRFTFHSIDDEGEKRTLEWVYDNLKDGGLFCLEVRTIKDPIFGLGEDKGGNVWFYNNHHRRFINSKSFKDDLISLGFELLYFNESNGFAKFEDQDPVVLRVIARRN